MPAPGLQAARPAQRNAPAAGKLAAAGKAKARAAAQDFEAVFLNSMFQQMFTGIDGDGPFGGSGATGVWRSFLTDEYAKSFAKAGGIGIADHVYQSLMAHQESALVNARAADTRDRQRRRGRAGDRQSQHDHGPPDRDGRGRDRARARRPSARGGRARADARPNSPAAMPPKARACMAAGDLIASALPRGARRACASGTPRSRRCCKPI